MLFHHVNFPIRKMAESPILFEKPEVFKTIIKTLHYLSADIVKLVLQTQDGRKIHYLPGQFAQIDIPESNRAQPYAFSGASGKNTVEFLIRILPDGLMSNYLRDKAKVGDSLQITAPLGQFYWRENSTPALFFAGGTGIAPFLAMLEQLNPTHKAMQPIKLFYGANTDNHLVELDRLNAFKNTLPFEYKTCSLEPSDQHAQGLVTQWISKDYLGNAAYNAYVCGPPIMVEAVKNTMSNKGVKMAHLFVPY